MSNYSFENLYTVDHMTHVNNLEGILAQGLLAHNNAFQKVDISNQAVNKRRSAAEPVYNKKIHDYVPFYFNPRNAMQYKNKNQNIIILGFDKNIVATDGAVYTNGNASRSGTHFSNDKNFLKQLNWKEIFSQSWCNYGEYDDGLKSRMMSELLIPNNVSIDDLEVIFCKTENMKTYIMKAYDLNGFQIIVEPRLFF
jgi:hypothetical protein